MATVAPTWKVTSRSAKSTQAIARKIGQSLEPGTVLAFRGDLSSTEIRPAPFVNQGGRVTGGFWH